MTSDTTEIARSVVECILDSTLLSILRSLQLSKGQMRLVISLSAEGIKFSVFKEDALCANAYFSSSSLKIISIAESASSCTVYYDCLLQALCLISQSSTTPNKKDQILIRFSWSSTEDFLSIS